MLLWIRHLSIKKRVCRVLPYRQISISRVPHPNTEIGYDQQGLAIRYLHSHATGPSIRLAGHIRDLSASTRKGRV